MDAREEHAHWNFMQRLEDDPCDVDGMDAN
jgi:hypothetical protein